MFLLLLLLVLLHNSVSLVYSINVRRTTNLLGYKLFLFCPHRMIITEYRIEQEPFNFIVGRELGTWDGLMP